jgi:hypothetical protein
MGATEGRRLDYKEPGEARQEAELQQARMERALRSGWRIRYDGARDVMAAARDEVTAPTIDGLLDKIGVPRD